MSDEDLIDDLAKGEQASIHSRPCQVCESLARMSEDARSAVIRALTGTIGERKLSDILTGNGYPTGRRAVNHHRSERHTS